MKWLLIGMAATAALVGNAAAQQQWEPVARHVDVRAGSFELRTMKGSDASIATGIVRVRIGNTFKFARAGVLLTDCERGYGKLSNYDIGTNAFLYAYDYVQDGGTVASDIADSLCEAAEEELAERREVPPPPPRAGARGTPI